MCQQVFIIFSNSPVLRSASLVHFRSNSYRSFDSHLPILHIHIFFILFWIVNYIRTSVKWSILSHLYVLSHSCIDVNYNHRVGSDNFVNYMTLCNTFQNVWIVGVMFNSGIWHSVDNQFNDDSRNPMCVFGGIKLRIRTKTEKNDRKQLHQIW
jgi:hypothetical protein